MARDLSKQQKVKMIRRAAKREGVRPELLLAQMNQESGLQTTISSPAGAQDIAQFMPGTAKGYGVTLGDGRPHDDIKGAAKHMRDLLDQFGGDERKALAAYNAGAGAVQKYGGVPPYAETQNYVKVILGAAGKSKGPRARPARARRGGGGGGTPDRIKTTVTDNPLTNSMMRDADELQRNAVLEMVRSGDMIDFALNMKQGRDLVEQAEALPATVDEQVIPGRPGRRPEAERGRTKYGPKLSGKLPNIGREADRVAQKLGLPLGSHARSIAHNRAVGGSEDSDHVMERGGRWARDYPSRGEKNIQASERIAERYGLKRDPSGFTQGTITVDGKKYRIQIIDAGYKDTLHDDHVHTGLRAL